MPSLENNPRFRYHPGDDYESHVPDGFLKDKQAEIDKEQGNVDSHVPPGYSGAERHSAPTQIRNHVKNGGELPGFAEAIDYSEVNEGGETESAEVEETNKAA